MGSPEIAEGRPLDDPDFRAYSWQRMLREVPHQTEQVDAMGRPMSMYQRRKHRHYGGFDNFNCRTART